MKKQFPLLMNGMWNGSEKLNAEDTIETVINQGTLVFGFIGLQKHLLHFEVYIMEKVNGLRNLV